MAKSVKTELAQSAMEMTPGDILAQSAMEMSPEEILEHHGVKGQKWGVRNDHKTGTHTVGDPTTKTSKLRRSASDVSVRQKPGQFVKTAGGKRQTASTDAVKSAASRQFVKKSTTDSLTTKQLQEAVQRMNLEVQYHQLVKKTDRLSRGQRMVKALTPAAKSMVLGQIPKPPTPKSKS